MNMPLRDMKPPVDYISNEYWGPKHAADEDETNAIDLPMFILTVGVLIGVFFGYLIWG
jgi:hypothetical protein